MSTTCKVLTWLQRSLKRRVKNWKTYIEVGIHHAILLGPGAVRAGRVLAVLVGAASCDDDPSAALALKDSSTRVATGALDLILLAGHDEISDNLRRGGSVDTGEGCAENHSEG